MAALILASLILAAVAGAQSAPVDSTRVEGIPRTNMVLVHGVGSSSHVWDDLIPSLERGFELWLYELPGHGHKKPIRNLTIESATRDLAVYLDDNNVREPILVGHGIGGMIAMNYAFNYTSDVSKLIVIDTTPKQLADKENKTRIAESLMNDYDAFVAGYFLNLSAEQDVTDIILDQALRTDQISLTQLLMSSFDFDLTEDLFYQTVPILVIGSAAMLPYPEVAVEHLDIMGFANAQTLSYKVMSESGHFVMLEDPFATLSAIIGFAVSD